MTRNRLLAGAIAGVLGGSVSGLLAVPATPWPVHLPMSGVLGVLFGLGFGVRVRTAGSGLMWGQAYGILWWLAGTLTLLPLVDGRGLQWTVPAIQGSFPHLLAHMVGFGAVLGLAMHGLGRLFPFVTAACKPPAEPRVPELVPPLVQALVVGGVGGLLGAWVFLWGIETAGFFPVVAGMVGMGSPTAGGLLHYLIGLVIAMTFALLFHRDVGGTGSALIWGMGYGVLWWILGPLTLLPLFTHSPVQWTVEAARANYSSLVAHLLYGAVVGWVYAVVNRLWVILFVDSDPLSRTREGAGTRSVRGLLMGQAGGILGGILFTVVMYGVGALPNVASLVGSRSPLVGVLVHFAISILIGSSFGLLFQRHAHSPGAGMSWGLSYGVLWWLLGALTLFPALLRQPVDWSLAAASANYASLIGHLFYGVGLGLLLQHLVSRYDSAWQPGRQRDTGTPEALWAGTVLVTVILPLVLHTAAAAPRP